MAVACQMGDKVRIGEEAKPNKIVESPPDYSTANEADGNRVSSEAFLIQPVLVAEGTTTRQGDESKVSIRVWLKKGKEVTDPNPGAFQGTFVLGQFEVAATTADGKELARFGLNDAFAGEELSFRKDQPFPLQFDDYNGDGFPDFTIGQWGGSNGNLYSLLTFGPNGFRVLESSIYSSDHRGSIRYRKVGGEAFVNSFYDQQQGKHMEVIHRWKDGAFTLDTPVEAQEVHSAGLEDGEMVERTVAIHDPGSWVVKTDPADRADNVPSHINTLSIEFDRDMDSNSLSTSTIVIVEGKHGHMLQDGYKFQYDVAARTLTLTSKDAESSFGSSNYIDINLSKEIKNRNGEKMGVSVQFGFAVP